MIPAIVQVKQKEGLSMKSQEKFTYSYSASQKAEIEAIRRKYLPRQETRMEELRRLDSAVTKKAAAFAIAWGTLFALIFGGGLSLSLEQSGTLLLAGIALGLPGSSACCSPTRCMSVWNEEDEKKSLNAYWRSAMNYCMKPNETDERTAFTESTADLAGVAL